MEQAREYWAFISYSHTDRKWGDWLHKALETYRVPPRIARKASRDGKHPNRLFPIFRDREELPSAASLTDGIEDALRRSRYLIVICSPRSATSRWVNEEVKAFKALGRQDRILCLIVDGEPNALDKSLSRDLECFAPALRARAGPGGKLSRKPIEPIAADARPGKDGRRNALLKIISGLLGVGFDELKQREKERQAELLKAKRQQGARASAERGRLELKSGHYSAAVDHLLEARKNDDTDSEASFLLARALEAVERPCVKLVGHTAAISTIEFSADGNRVVTASRDATARIWDAQTGRLLRTLEPHDGAVWRAQFSPDGSKVVTGTEPGTTTPILRIWDAASGKLLRRLDEYWMPPNQFVFDPDSTLFIVLTDYDTPNRILDLESGEAVASIGWEAKEKDEESPSPNLHVIKYATFLPGRDRRLLIGCGDGYARLVDARSGEVLKAYGPHEGPIFKAFVMEDADHLRVITKQPVTRWEWKLSTGALEERRSRKLNFVPGTGDMSDRYMLASLTQDGLLKIWEMFTGDVHGSVRPHNGDPSSARFSPNGAYVMTTTGGRLDPQEAAAKLWDVTSGRLAAAIGGHVGGTTFAVAISREGDRIALTENNIVRVWKVPEIPARAHEKGKTIRWMRFVGEDSALLVLTDDDEIEMRDPSGRLLDILNVGCKFVAADSRGRWIVAASPRGDAGFSWLSIDLWRHSDRSWVHVASTSNAARGRLAVSSNGSLVSFVNEGGNSLEVWEVIQATELGRRDGWHYSCPWKAPFPVLTCLTPANDLLQIFAEEFVVVRFNSSEAATRATGMRVDRAFASRDQELVLIATDDGRARILRTDNLETISELADFFGDIKFAAFSEDNSRICVLAGEDEKVGVWHARTGKSQGAVALEGAKLGNKYAWLSKHDLILMLTPAGWGAWSTRSGKQLMWPEVTPWPDVFCVDASQSHAGLANGHAVRVVPLRETRRSADEIQASVNSIRSPTAA